MKNKGFTLVELLAVIVILGIIIAIAVPNVISVSKNTKQEMYETKVKTIEGAAKMYGQDNYESINGNYQTISVQSLLNNNYLKKEDKNCTNNCITNPVDNSSIVNQNVCLCTINKRVNAVFIGTSTTCNASVCGDSEESSTPTPEIIIPNTSIKVGDYIKMTPTLSSYTVSASLTGKNEINIKPSELDLWRVISKNADGTLDAVSEYLPSSSIIFYGITSYTNYIGTMQTIAMAYMNQKYTTKVRMMGYDGQTETIANNQAYNMSSQIAPAPRKSSIPSPTSGTGQEYTLYSKGDIGDTLYLKDYQLVSNVYLKDNNSSLYGSTGLKAYKVGTNNNYPYLIASRYYNYIYDSSDNIDIFSFDLRMISEYGSLSSDTVLEFMSDNPSYYGSFRNVTLYRPIITLKSGITAVGGNGNKNDPYILS